MIVSFFRKTFSFSAPAALVLSLVFSAAAMRAEAPGPRIATTTSEPRVVVFNLQASCNSDVLQAIASKLSVPVTVKNVTDGPKFQNGAKYFEPNGDRPAFCEVSGSFVTDARTARMAKWERASVEKKRRNINATPLGWPARRACRSTDGCRR